MSHRIWNVVAATLVLGAFASSAADAYACKWESNRCVCTASSTGYCMDCNTAGCVEPESGVSCCQGGAGGGLGPRYPTP